MKEVNKRGLIIVAVIIALVVTCFGCSGVEKAETEKEKHSIFEYEDLISTYIGSIIHDTDQKNMSGDGYFDLQENGSDYVNYWDVTARAITWVIEYRKDIDNNVSYLQKAISVEESLMDTFERNGKFPRPEYQGYEYGWVSSMDAPTVMVLTQMLYEITEDEIYKNFGDELKEYIVKDVSEGGYNIKLGGIFDNRIWPLEYADDIKEEDEFYFVNNGSIAGYLGVKLISLTEYDEALEKYLESVESAYESMQDRFLYDKYNWTFYMLNEPTVIPPHYMIFEEKLYYVCSEISDKTFWKEGYEFRKKALKDVLSIDFYKEDGVVKGVMRRACAPHPYLLDIYSTKVEFLDENDNVIGEWTEDISGSSSDNIERFEEGEFLTGVMPENSVCYRTYTIRDNQEFLLFESEIDFEESFKNEEIISGLPDASGNITNIQTNQYEYDFETSGNNRAILTYNLEENIDLDINNYYGISIDNGYQNNYNITITLYDSQGDACSRYLPVLKAGKNLLLFNEIGFPRINDLTDISKVTIRLYTEEDASEGSLYVDELIKFENIYSLYKYRQEHSEYKISPQ